MKTLLKISCWANITIMVLASIGMYSMAGVTAWAWVIVSLGIFQSAVTLVYIRQHDRLDKDQADQAEHDRIKAEVLAELN